MAFGKSKIKRNYWNLWKVLKLILDIILFALSINCLGVTNKTLFSFLFIYVFFIALVFLVNSFLELVSYNHDFLKKFLLHILTCQKNPNNVVQTEEQKKKDDDSRCLAFFLFLPFGIIYFLGYSIIN